MALSEAARKVVDDIADIIRSHMQRQFASRDERIAALESRLRTLESKLAEREQSL